MDHSKKIYKMKYLKYKGINQFYCTELYIYIYNKCICKSI